VLFAIFGAVALPLAAIVMYGVISYAVTRRAGEMGIRAAWGALPGKLLTLNLRSGIFMTTAALVLGMGGSLGLPELMKAFLLGVGTWYLLTLTAVAAILGCAALVACYIPARRATKVDPIIALRL